MESYHDQWMDAMEEVHAVDNPDVRETLARVLSRARKLMADEPSQRELAQAGILISVVRECAAEQVTA